MADPAGAGAGAGLGSDLEDDADLGLSRESTAVLLPESAPAPTDSLRNSLLVLLVSSIGNILEWFDFAVFGYFADVTRISIDVN